MAAIDALDRFADQAQLYQQWARHGTTQSSHAAREALMRISALYLAGAGRMARNMLTLSLRVLVLGTLLGGHEGAGCH